MCKHIGVEKWFEYITSNIYYIDFIFLIAALIGFRKPHAAKNKKLWL